MVKLKAPKDTGSASVDGVEYKAVDGFVEVPDEVVYKLVELGFVQCVEEEPKISHAAKKHHGKKSESSEK